MGEGPQQITRTAGQNIQDQSCAYSVLRFIGGGASP